MSMIQTVRALALAATVATAAMFGTAQAYEDFEPLPVFVTNASTEFGIAEVYISAVTSDVWGPNLIDDTLYPEDYAEVVPVVDDGDCYFDVLLVFDDGVEMPIENVDLCEVNDISTDGYEYDLYTI